MTTTDRELLDLAAKAADIAFVGYDPAAGLQVMYAKAQQTFCDEYWFWNPLTDDGDALKLAVKLGVIVGTYASFSTVDLLSPNDQIETVTVWHSETSGDPCAATRCAIVRAAAEIGKAKP